MKAYTITQLSKKFNVSRQTIYNKLDDSFEPYLTKLKGAKVLNEEGYEVLKGLLDCKEIDNDNKYFVKIVEQYEEQIDLLKKQLEIMNKKNDELVKQLESKSLSIQNPKDLKQEFRNEVKQLLIDSKKESSWFKNIFKKGD